MYLVLCIRSLKSWHGITTVDLTGSVKPWCKAQSTMLLLQSAAVPIDWQKEISPWLTQVSYLPLLFAMIKLFFCLFPFSPCTYLTHVYIFGWLFRSFWTFLRFEGKFDHQFLHFFLWLFCAQKNHFSISEPPFFSLLLRITDRQWRELMWMLAWVQSCMLIQKRYVLSAFFAFFVDEYWQPISNLDSHLFLSFFKQIQSYWFPEGLQEGMTSASIVIITHFVFLGQGPPSSLTEVAAEVTSFSL